MYEEKKLCLESYTLQNRRIYRLTEMMARDPAQKEKYAQEIQRAHLIRKSIEEKIAQTDGDVLSELLYLKYVCGKTLEEIAAILNYSERHTERLHQKALKHFPL